MDPKVKINGFPAVNGQHLVGGIQLLTVDCVDAEADLTNKYVLEALINTINIVAQPVILGAIKPGATGHSTLTFAIEHTDAFKVVAPGGTLTTATAAGTTAQAHLQAMLQALSNDKVALTFANGAGATFADFRNITVAATTL